MLDLILKWLIPFVCGGIVTLISTLFVKVRAISNGLQCLLRAEIINAHEKYADKRYCPIYAKEALTRAYKAYHALHGNDVATELYHACMALPTEPPDESSADGGDCYK